MIVLGFVLALIGLLAAIPILWSLGVTVLVIGIILMVLGTLGHSVGGRRSAVGVTTTNAAYQST